MLVLVPKRTTFVFTLTYADEDSKTSIPGSTKGTITVLFLLKKVLWMEPAKQKSAHGFITFSKVDEEEQEACDQSGKHFDGIPRSKALGMKDYGVFNGILRFTYFDNFLSCLRNKVELCDLISAHFDLIVLGPDSDIRKAGKEGNATVQQIHQFCGYDLLRA
jgi:hypothetical protein